MKEIVVSRYLPVVQMLLEKGCTVDEAVSFISNNVDFLGGEIDSIKDKLFLICNNKKKYALLFVDGNDYKWSIYKDDEFKTIKKIDEDTDLSEVERSDFIVEMMIDFSKKAIVQQLAPDIKNMNIEGKVKTLKRIGLNSNGYHFK